VAVLLILTGLRLFKGTREMGFWWPFHWHWKRTDDTKKSSGVCQNRHKCPFCLFEQLQGRDESANQPWTLRKKFGNNLFFPQNIDLHRSLLLLVIVRTYDTWPILLPQMTSGDNESVTPTSNGRKPITSTMVTLVTLWLIEREKFMS
jgi:hypothetical protein